MNQEILQLGTLGILFALAIKEFFGYLKSRKNGNGNGKIDKEQSKEITNNSTNIAVMLQRLKTIEENHLPHLMLEEGKNRDEHKQIMEKLIIIEAKVVNLNNNKIK